MQKRIVKNSEECDKKNLILQFGKALWFRKWNCKIPKSF